MLTLPALPAPNGAQPRLIDAGTILRPSTGAAPQHFARGGSRFAVDLTFPPMKPDTARLFVRRLLGGKREGIRVEYPLLDVNQSGGGSPLVSALTVGGASLPLKGMTPSFVVKEGWWLTVIGASDVRCLHCVAADATVNGSGLVTLAVDPPLRISLATNSVVLLTTPTVEGLVTSEPSWEIPNNRLISLGFTIEEMA